MSNTKPITDTKTHKISTSTSTIEVKTTTLAGKGSKARRPNVTVLLDTDDLVKEQVGGFIDFLREHAIVGLAVGFVIGQQAQGVIKQLVASFVDPTIQLFFGGAKLSERTVTLHLFVNEAKFGWGAMIYSLLNLVFVLATIYILIKVLNLDKLDKPKAP